MKVINILSDGSQVEDMSKITIPITHEIYEVCRRLSECQSSDDNSD